MKWSGRQDSKHGTIGSSQMKTDIFILHANTVWWKTITAHPLRDGSGRIMLWGCCPSILKENLEEAPKDLRDTF